MLLSHLVDFTATCHRVIILSPTSRVLPAICSKCLILNTHVKTTSSPRVSEKTLFEILTFLVRKLYRISRSSNFNKLTNNISFDSLIYAKKEKKTKTLIYVEFYFLIIGNFFNSEVYLHQTTHLK